MKALNLHQIGDLRLDELPDPIPGKGEVLVKIMASGVCGSDIPRIFSKGTYHFPTVPGHEFSGRIVELGEGVDPDLLQRKAAIFPLLPCFSCDACRVGEYAQCRQYDYFGSRRDGGFAEYIAVPVWNVLSVPEELSFQEAAMAEPSAVAVHALRQGKVEVGDTVVIFGAGPIGLMLARWAQIMGAHRTVLVDIDDRKVEFARAMGFEYLIHSLREDAIERIKLFTDGRGADLCVEGAGVSAALEQCMFATRPFGRIVAMGNPVSDMRLSQNAYWELLRKQLNLAGTWNSSYGNLPKDDWKLSIQAMSEGLLNVRPFITHQVPLEDYQQVFAIMKDKSEFFNKIMFRIGDDPS
jgi:L-iditol 2-dehydrogenase